MTEKEVTDDEKKAYLLTQGYEFTEKGMLVDNNGLGHEYDKTYWDLIDLTEFMTPCSFWSHPDREFATEDIDEAYEHAQEYEEDEHGNS